MNDSEEDCYMNLAQEILEIIEDYLEEKGVLINNPEREEDENAALIYGTEYGNLECEINEAINGKECHIDTCMGGCDGVLMVMDGKLYIESNDLDSYLENYSIE